MAYQEREKQREIAKLVDEGVKEKLPNAVNSELDAMSYYRRIRRTGWIGATVVLAASLAGGLVGFDQGTQQGTQQGKQKGTQDERNRIVSSGILLPETREKLTGKQNLVVNVKGITAEGLRRVGITVPEFPVAFPDGDGNPETTTSSHSFLGVRPDGIYLPREEDDTVGDLTSDLNTANRAAGTIDNSLGFSDGTYSDFLEAEGAALISPTGESIFKPGMFVAMSHRLETEDGVSIGFAIGRETPEDPITIITFDATPEALLPPNISAGGFVVAK